MNKDQEVQLKTAKLLFTETIINNTDLNEKEWVDVEKFRKECISEFIKYLETGKIDHVAVPVDHFK